MGISRPYGDDQRRLANADPLPTRHNVEITNRRGAVMARLWGTELDALRKRAERFAKGQGWVINEA